MYKTALTPQLPVAVRDTKDDPLKNPRFKAAHDGHGKIQAFTVQGLGEGEPMSIECDLVQVISPLGPQFLTHLFID